MALKMRFGTTVSDLQDTLCAHPVFSMQPEEYNRDILNMAEAFRKDGRELPHFTNDFNVFIYAHRSPELAAWLLTVLDAVLAFDAKRTRISLSFEYQYNIRDRAYDFLAHVDVARPVEHTTIQDHTTGNWRQIAVSNRSAPRSILVTEAPPPPPAPPPEPPRRRMTLRRAAELKSIAKSP